MVPRSVTFRCNLQITMRQDALHFAHTVPHRVRDLGREFEPRPDYRACRVVCVSGGGRALRALLGGVRWLLARGAIGAPYGTRTRVTAVKGRCPGPLDEGRMRVTAKRGEV